ncbi:MAG: hypothetical protein HY782_00640 [Chloroflexi bacterium]|nr:hypothetical protein [Chloroflexota bacterium]
MRKHLTVLTLYILIALVLSWPLALNFASAIPGVEGDAASFVWAMGWAKTALADLRVNPFHTDYVFYPLGGATQLLWATSLVGLVSIPLQYVFGLIVTYNLLYLAATVLTAYGTFLLAEFVIRNSEFRIMNYEFDQTPLPPLATVLLTQFITQNRKLATRHSSLGPFVAGLVFAFAPLRQGYGLAFFNLFHTELIPFYLLFLLRAAHEKSWRLAILAGVFLGLNTYIDFQIAAFLILLTGVFVAKDPKGLPKTRRVWATTALTSLMIAIPILLAVANDFAVEGGNYIRVYKLDYSAARSYDLLSFFVPNARSTLYADSPLKIANVNAAVQAQDESALSPDRQPFVGYIVLALAAFAVARRWRQARFWLVVAGLFALFSLGPSLHIFGRETGIPLPFLALHEIPIVNHIRIPMRYGIIVPLALAMLVAMAIDNLQRTIDKWRLEVRSWRLEAGRWKWRDVLRIRLASLALALVPVGILVEFAVLPYPAQPVTIPRVYAAIAREPGDFTILEIPTFHWRGAAAAELYQPIHGKRILRAYTNRIAPGLAEYFGYRGTPIVVRSLRVLEGAEQGELAPDDIAEDKRVRDQVVQFFNLRYALLHRSYLKPNEVGAIDRYLRDVLGARLIDDDGQVIAYQIPPTTSVPEVIAIDLRENIGQMYAGRGWQFEYPPANWNDEFNFVWARGARSEIYFVAGDAAERVVTLHARAESPQRVNVYLNDQPVGEIALTTEWRDHEIALPARAVVSGMNRLTLDYGGEFEETVAVTIIQIRQIDIRRGNHGTQTSR